MPAPTRSPSSSSVRPKLALMALLLPPPQPDALIIFIGGLAAGMALMFIMLAPILAKGMEAHHHFPPNPRRRRRMILGYCGVAVGALFLAVYALTYSTPLYASRLRLLMSIAGLVVGLGSTGFITSALSMREPVPLAGHTGSSWVVVSATSALAEGLPPAFMPGRQRTTTTQREAVSPGCARRIRTTWA